uniref:hypothetical protein n=1 Tax=Nonomuraea sp. CA-251285 TaxID=3240002 RepID=UPI003F49B3EE
MDTARVIVEVVAGLLPGRPDAGHTRRWVLTSQQWDDLADDVARSAALAELNGRAQGYAGLLMLQPDRLNWVRLDWIWP